MTDHRAGEAGPVVGFDDIPPWLHTLLFDVDAVTESVNNRGGDRTRWATLLTPDRRAAAVLILFAGSWEAADDHPGGVPADADVLLLERASTLRQHSGQVAFPGGAADPGDDFPVGTALREAVEETGLDPAGVRILGTLPSFPIAPSGFDVVPVIAWWDRPGRVWAVDPGETARVARVNLRELLAPENRFQVQRPTFGGRSYRGPAFLVSTSSYPSHDPSDDPAELLVWGFTGGLIAAISAVSGWDRPWDTADVRSLEAMIEAAGSPQESGFAALHRRMHAGEWDSGDSDGDEPRSGAAQ